MKCTSKFTNEEKNLIISKLYDGKPKNEQDTFLQGLIETKSIVRRRKRIAGEKNAKPRAASFQYYVMKNHERILASGTKLFNILHISDIHYDPLYTPGKSSKCGEPLCCQADQPDGTDASNTCGYWTDYKDADIPLHTIHESLNQTVSTHIFSWSSESDTDKTLSTQWLFDLVAEQWSDWLTDDAKQTILRGGYYTISPRKGFRVIVLNTNVCYLENWWLLNEDRDPYDQLEWLSNTLLNAENNQESVHILSHIPTGSSGCLQVWSREYRKIVERFANTITGQFNGHTHKDELSLYYSSSQPIKPINVAWNGASITPFSNSNPSYKLYQIDQDTFDVLDYEEWTFNLTLANLDPHQPVQWYKLYSFKEAYGVTSLEPNQIDVLIYRMSLDHSLINKYNK
ncbi:hypothetical protein NQ314_006076 [Rhamnusium bicolor]|uniref:Sphingomyelin phosphodiesterase C-terminal domain-containing protein n=1 Tax=Rhamnusium bicolor TaxID=1586634 RepID=A0AAV8ZA73_9CUCU|nr:hypothetical protein NQ314_006076 [Rhamnusium bicolor]